MYLRSFPRTNPIKKLHMLSRPGHADGKGGIEDFHPLCVHGGEHSRTSIESEYNPGVFR
jgi:hypothetical protein